MNLSQIAGASMKLSYNPYNMQLGAIQWYPAGTGFIYFFATGSDNGKVTSMQDSTTGKSVNYTYDVLNRLKHGRGVRWLLEPQL